MQIAAAARNHHDKIRYKKSSEWLKSLLKLEVHFSCGIISGIIKLEVYPDYKPIYLFFFLFLCTTDGNISPSRRVRGDAKKQRLIDKSSINNGTYPQQVSPRRGRGPYKSRVGQRIQIDAAFELWPGLGGYGIIRWGCHFYPFARKTHPENLMPSSLIHQNQTK